MKIFFPCVYLLCQKVLAPFMVYGCWVQRSVKKNRLAFYNVYYMSRYGLESCPPPTQEQNILVEF